MKPATLRSDDSLMISKTVAQRSFKELDQPWDFHWLISANHAHHDSLNLHVAQAVVSMIGL